MLQIKVNDDKLIKVWKEGSIIFAGDESLSPDIVWHDNHTMHVLHNHTSYCAEVLKFDKKAKLLTLLINGHLFHIEAKDSADLLLQKIGVVSQKSNAAATLLAPMPGLIIQTFVVPGQHVRAGDQILILEAMKMENIIKAHGDCIVESVHVEAGRHVEKNQLLVTFIN